MNLGRIQTYRPWYPLISLASKIHYLPPSSTAVAFTYPPLQLSIHMILSRILSLLETIPLFKTWIHLQCGRPGFDPWVGKIPWRRAWQPTPVFLLGESPWTEEPGGLQSMELQRVRHDWVTTHTYCTPLFQNIYLFSPLRLHWSNVSENGRVRISKNSLLHKNKEETDKKLSESTFSKLLKLIKDCKNSTNFYSRKNSWLLLRRVSLIFPVPITHIPSSVALKTNSQQSRWKSACRQQRDRVGWNQSACKASFSRTVMIWPVCCSPEIFQLQGSLWLLLELAQWESLFPEDFSGKYLEAII